ncbi:toxin-antitoxin system HicB family antitoxin [Haloechinothrix sp. YIM 98757]|uniref:Toxin-antitoxin system HicB family antitoxin n=1 Tax=Haloechinothrix aidingensis TaxID=2752311 RepID=A0A838A9Z8_9PSEU|nr:toxin-antitoxin system HicB family antitoxin [Haloechinothrix aidingensis]MBA0126157.1 toxin-antitoxin system HicB family antitoxin [Haloechinothrix aidingensis]
MDLGPYIDTLREDLTATAAAGDDHARRVAATLAGALEPSVRLALMNALSDLAAEVTAQLDEHVVDVRLDGRDVRVVVTSPTGTAGATDTTGTTGTAGAADGARSASAAGYGASHGGPFTGAAGLGDGGDISRMTLRLLDQIKGKAEEAAAAQGVSLNTYVSRAVQSAVQAGTARHGRAAAAREEHDTPSDGSHLHGWVRG